MDRTWFEIKRNARAVAKDGREFAMDQARETVARLLQESLVEAPPEALEFLAREMLSLVKEFRAAQAAEKSA